MDEKTAILIHYFEESYLNAVAHNPQQQILVKHLFDQLKT